ncbi:CD3324 family protein [Heyndrickxia oleronia]|uniref:CD3324 family protein n=2 Tax=Heyndrickxia oleronia TaxID=38875 RepID=UPI001FEF90F0|nr:CD3324 family protein [Heyndrickxia oleronia]
MLAAKAAISEENDLAVFAFYIYNYKKAGTEMGYKKADDFLPKELVLLIQNYVDGDYIYIPRKKGNELSWGEKNGARKAIKNRNHDIYIKYNYGATKEQLAKEYHLSIKSIERIIYKQRE